MSNQPDDEKVKKLTAEGEKLDGESQHRSLRALHRRLNRTRARVEELEGVEEKEAKEKNAPLVEEAKRRIASLREEIHKVLASSDRAKRTRLKRVQRRLRKMRVVPFEELQKRTQQRADQIGKALSDMTKGMKKVQANAYVHSYRKKVKSLNKKVKKFARIQKKKEAQAPAAEGEKKA